MVASITMGAEVSQLRKSGSVNENQREDSSASMASSTVVIPESPWSDLGAERIGRGPVQGGDAPEVADFDLAYLHAAS